MRTKLKRHEIRPYLRLIETHAVQGGGDYRHECAVCFYTHADVKRGSNYYHSECLEELKHEFHKPPERLEHHERSRVP